MSKRQWSIPTSDGAAARRAGGRRRYNAERKRRMWERRFAILQICSVTGDLPHGAQQDLARRFGVSKSVISRDVAWVRKTGFFDFDDGFTLRCSYRRGAVTIEWTNPAPSVIVKNARRLLKAAKRDKLEAP